jgi:ribosomal 30S subunit maturation factor RimM
MALRPVSRVDDYTFPPDAWDVRGWTVRTEMDDEKVGKVEDMLLDAHGSLRYLDVDLGFLKKHVLVPLNNARAERETETVRIEGMNKDWLEDVPEYGLEPESLDEGYERRLDRVYGSLGAASAAARGTSDPSTDTSARPLSVGADADSELELRRMEALEGDYQVAGEDPRGWDVVTADGHELGEVSELLMDPGAMKARFLDVAVDEKKLDLEPVDRHILLPADRVRLDRNKKRVVVGGLLTSDVARYPQYGGLPVRARTVYEVDEFFERAGTQTESRPGEGGAGEHRGDTPARHFYGGTRGRDVNPTGEEYHG